MRTGVAVALRLFALVSRLLSLVVLATFLTPADVGLYGLLIAAIAYLSYPLGLDFYTFSTREIIRTHRKQRRWILKGHGSLLSLTYVLVLPASLILFATSLLPWWVAPWFLVLLPLEHLGLEMDRLLVASGDPMGASAAVFLRQGLWPGLVGVLFWQWPESRALSFAFGAWALCAAAAFVWGLARLVKAASGGVRQSLDWVWIRRGVRVAAFLLVGTLMLRVLFTADRYIVAAVADPEVLAAYTLFVGLANGLTQGISAAVHQFQYPRLVAAEHTRDDVSFRRVLRAMTTQTIALCAVFVVSSLVVVAPLVDMLDSDAYRQELWMMPWLLAATVLFNLSMVPHFVLYSRDGDRILTFSAGLALMVFATAVAMAALTDRLGPRAVLLGLVLANSALLISKLLAARVARRRTADRA